MENAVLITGTDRGLGFELAKNFLNAGFYVFAGRYLKKWTLLEQMSQEHPDTLDIIDLDVGSDESVKSAATYIQGKTDKIDMIINVAALQNMSDSTIFNELDFKKMLSCYNVTALGALRICNALIIELMNGFYKLIVNISSEAGSIGTCWRYDNYGYCMAKAALNMNSAITHNRLHREFNGQVLNIHPGGMAIGNEVKGPDTPMSTTSGKMFINHEQSAKHIFDLIMDQERFKSDHPALLITEGTAFRGK